MLGDLELSTLPAGTIVGNRYEVRATIAMGGMGCVYLAHNVMLDMPVALKVLRHELSTHPLAVERFQREALLAGEVRHPNIVGVIDFGHPSEPLPYLVMEYVAGPSLAELVHAEGPQPVARVVPLVRQLLAALEELHEHGIVHGDVTSQNLLLQPASDGDTRLKLVDFGLARRVGTRDRAARARPRSREVSGTPGFMAPEALRGEALGPAADIYSAGIVLHELLTGELPPAEPSLLSVGYPHLAIPKAFDGLLARALSPEEGDRLGAAPLSAALDAASLGRPPEPRATWRRPAGGAQDATPTVVLVRTLPSGIDRPRQLRDRIGTAMRSGNVDQMADLYLGLARLLRDTGDAAAAMAELSEGVDVLTQRSPPELWRLLLFLAELQATDGAIGAARASGLLAYRHAERMRSLRGRARALHLLRGLPR